jgi:hypothetical protein
MASAPNNKACQSFFCYIAGIFNIWAVLTPFVWHSYCINKYHSFKKKRFMPQKHHEDAAKHHEEAAKHHRSAAEHSAKGNHQQAADHAQAANGHSSQAREEGEKASKKHAEKHHAKK